MKRKRNLLIMLMFTITLISVCTNSYAHPGKTDSKGGHKDNQNKSGLGSYHYHCDGMPAHLHPNGICPYTEKKTTSNDKAESTKQKQETPAEEKPINNTKKTEEDKTSIQNSESKTADNKKDVKEEIIDNEIKATDVKIKIDKTTMTVGENQIFKADIIPDDTINKEVKWESSDESILTIRQDGMTRANKAGKAYITAITSNGKTDTVEINIEEKIENNIIEENTINTANAINEKTEESNNLVGGILGIAIIGGIGFTIYKKYNKKQNNNTKSREKQD